MEPVTYFTGFGVSIFGYFWWSLTRSEYEYENVHDFLLRKKKRQLYGRHGFDVKGFYALERELQGCHQQLREP